MAQNRPYRLDKRKLAWTIGFFLIVIIAVYALMRRSRAAVAGIDIKIEQLPIAEKDLIRDVDILKILKVAFEDDIATLNVKSVDVGRVEEVLEREPMILNAEAYFDINNRLQIRIEQREPILRVLDNNGQSYYLDKTGVKMQTSRYYAVRVPVATGAVPPHTPDFLSKSNYLLKDVFYIAERIKTDAFLAALVQEIHVDAGGDIILIPTLGDQKIKIGSIVDLDDKLDRLKIFYDKAMPYEGWKTYSSINLKYKGQIVAKKK